MTLLIKIFLLFLVSMASTSIASTDKKTYVIHMDKTQITATGSTHQHYEAVINELTAQDDQEEATTLPPQLLYVYETAISGFAAKLSTKQLDSLRKLDGFLVATPDEMLSLHTTHTPQFLGLQTGRGLWSAPSLASDVIIGVIDTGIWPEHVSFNDKGMSPVPSQWKGACENGTRFSSSNCNKKIIGARAFFKGYEELAGRINETEEYRSPRDSEGHGTHTASTAAGNVVEGASFLGVAKGSAAGMRYTARIAAYKACWSLGCASSDLVAAIDKAVADGVHVLSLSLGGVSKPYYTDSIAIASFGAIRNGVSVSCSAGNSGPSSSTVSNTAPWIMTVAASYLDRSFPTTVRLGNGQRFQGSSLYSGTKIKKLPLVYGESAGKNVGAEYCIGGSLSSELVKGKIVVCEQGLSSGARKEQQVTLAGGAGMLLLNADRDGGEEILAQPFVIPATSLGASAGKAIKKYVNSTSKPKATIAFAGTVYGNRAPAMAAFSSRGPNTIGPEVIKPDLTAPGAHVLAAWPPKTSPSQLKSDNRSVLFNIISGTSMSCPHVSGIAALLKSVHEEWSPAAIKSAMMTTAYTLDNKNAPIGDVGSSNSMSPATPFASGSGHVEPESASDPGLIYDVTPEDYLNYLCGHNYSSSQIALFSSGTNFSCPDNATLQPASDLNYPSFAVIFFRNSSLNVTEVSQTRTVTNVGSPTSTYNVKVNEPSGVSVKVEPEILDFKKSGERLSYKVRLGEVGVRATGHSSFGSLVWESAKYRVKSPIAVTWK